MLLDQRSMEVKVDEVTKIIVILKKYGDTIL